MRMRVRRGVAYILGHLLPVKTWACFVAFFCCFISFIHFFFSICMWNSLLLLHFCSFPLSNSKPASTKAPASNADTREYTRTPRCSLGVHICRGIKFRRQMSTLRLSQKWFLLKFVCNYTEKNLKTMSHCVRAAAKVERGVTNWESASSKQNKFTPSQRILSISNQNTWYIIFYLNLRFDNFPLSVTFTLLRVQNIICFTYAKFKFSSD